MKKKIKAAVLGDGGWGTALAVLLHRNGYDVRLWSAFSDYAEILKKKRENIKFLPGVKIPSGIKIASDLNDSVLSSELVVFAIPTQYLRNVIYKIKNLDLYGKVFVSVAKGIEVKTLLRPSEIIKSLLKKVNLAVLSGPSHAEEVARGVPSCVVAASSSEAVAVLVQKYFMNNTFRVYTSKDVIGVELGAALKNVVSIAAGVSDGLGYGANTKAALLSRGLVEITRLGGKMKASPNTFFGLSGLGDLITSAVSEFGRNRQVGEQLGKGKKLKSILSEMEMVAEGVPTSKSALALAKKYEVAMPIVTEVNRILFEDKDPKEAVNDLMMRGPKKEMEFK